MVQHQRYGVYVVPEGEVYERASAWLGWDAVAAAEVGQPEADLPLSLAEITETPRKYGFHGTMKPPFPLAPGTDLESLKSAIAHLAARCTPVELPGLTLARLGHFLALVPNAPSPALARLAASCVTEIDPFRAAPSAEELARRRRAGLSAAQEALLTRWGYPYVLEEFRYHMTLTGKLPTEHMDPVYAALSGYLGDLPEPFIIDSLALMGERPDGHFELLDRFALSAEA